MTELTVAAETASKKVFNVLVSSMQTGLTIGDDNKITGTLKYLSGSNPITEVWGEGNFMVLKFSGTDPRATSVKIGLEPSEGSGLVELIGDPDQNAVIKVTDKDAQVFKIISIDGHGLRTEQTYDLSGLTCQDS